jgi:hypothetical protein
VTRFSFLLQFAVCFLGGCISAVGICCVIFCDGSFVVFLAVFFFFFFFFFCGFFSLFFRGVDCE